jgi:hypothetical protein
MKRNTIAVGKNKREEETKEDDLGIDKDRTFFCSELVAKAYKVCGIM